MALVLALGAAPMARISGSASKHIAPAALVLQGAAQPPPAATDTSTTADTAVIGESYTIADLIVPGQDSDDISKSHPPTVGGVPVNITGILTITNVFGISETDSTYTIQGQFVMQWADSRLHMPTGVSRVQLDDSDVWAPDIDFYNSIKLDEKPKLSFLQTDAGPMVTKTNRVTVDLTMRMDFTYYPGDKHALPVEVEIYSNPSTAVKFVETKVYLSEGAANLDKWDLTGVDWSTSEVLKPSTNLMYSRMTVHIEAARIILAYLFTCYGPLLLLQLIAWSTFFMDPKAVPARTAMCIITVLSSFTFYQHITADLATTGYVTFIDAVCVLTFLLAAIALAVFIRVHWLLRQVGKGPKEAGGPVVDYAAKAEALDDSSQTYFPLLILFVQLIGMGPVIRSWVLTFDMGDIE